jgi:hypothetical protein
VIDAIDLLRQVMNEEIARQHALRTSPPGPRRRDVAPMGRIRSRPRRDRPCPLHGVAQLRDGAG